MTRVAVLTGGSTPERDVALAGASQVVAALRSRGYRVTVVDTVGGQMSSEDERRRLVPVGKEPPTLEQLERLAERELGPELVDLPALRSADVVFLVLHGRQGEGGEMQTLLENAGLPYAGSDPVGSSLAMDKDAAKRLFRKAGVPTPDWRMWPVPKEAITALGFPLIVKPSRAGSTVGLTVVERADQVDAAVAAARPYDDDVMLEAYASGREFTVGILGDEALAVGEIIPSHEIFDYECKYTPGMTQEIFPADIAQSLADRLRSLALTAHHALGLRDFSRVDFRLGADGTPHCLEANTLPGLTATSLLPQSAAVVGIPFDELCHRICRFVLERSPTRNKAGT
ncbi:MAG: D-alanine--D-alanine ligase [Gemmatimonadota bacterium]|nr:MAG: D-alanine--D-alanine ligase [Gemmatimonadota bacterium]